MKKHSVAVAKEIGSVRWLLGGLSAITLYFQSNLADPFNSPKFWILMLVAAWSIGNISRYRHLIRSNQYLRFQNSLILIFIFTALLATLFTDSKYVAVFGDTQRRNGFLSYLSLAIILIATSLQMNWFNIKRFFITTYFIATISAIYALLQTTGNDFVSWANPYNSIIGTLGNPNFAGAVMAIMGVVIFSSLFNDTFTKYQRSFAFILVIFLLGLILRSNARQGLLSFTLGIMIFLIIWSFNKKRILGYIFLLGSITAFVFATLGMLQVGPLERFLYKPSVSVRGYYWRAGIDMFRDNPIFGVGMDRYGYYFNEYREVGYPLNYGFEITSSNAHNTFIQLFATGGALLGASYITLIMYVLVKAVKTFRNLSGNDKYIYSGIFAAWVAFHAQSLVSIDNIGVSIWGWVLSGILLSLSRISPTQSKDNAQNLAGKSKTIDLQNTLISIFAVSIVVFLIVFLYRGENNSYKASGSYNSQDKISVDIYRDSQLLANNSTLLDPNYSFRAASNLIISGSVEEGLAILQELHRKDKRNLTVLNALAYVYEVQSNFPEAILYREKIIKLNPWDATNYLALGNNYKTVGNLEKSREMFQKIVSFAIGVNGGPVAEQAKKELESIKSQ